MDLVNLVNYCFYVCYRISWLWWILIFCKSWFGCWSSSSFLSEIYTISLTWLLFPVLQKMTTFYEDAMLQNPTVSFFSCVLQLCSFKSYNEQSYLLLVNVFRKLPKLKDKILLLDSDESINFFSPFSYSSLYVCAAQRDVKGKDKPFPPFFWSLNGQINMLLLEAGGWQ